MTKSGSTTTIQSEKNPGHTPTSTAKPNIHGSKVMLCIWWDQKGVIYYELLKSGQTITADLYRTQLIRLKRALAEKRPEYASRHESVIFHHDNARPHIAKPVKNYLRFTSEQDIKNWLDRFFATNPENFFWDGIHKLPERWSKAVVSDGQYFE